MRVASFFLVLVVFSVVALKKMGCCSCCASNIACRSSFFDQEGAVVRPLEELLELLEIEHDGTLDSVVGATQKEWLRPAGKERWEVESRHEEKREQIMPLLEQLGCVHELLPSQKNYMYGIVLGALVSRVRTRFAFLIEQWKKGVRFEELVFFGGQRPLHSELESAEILFDLNNKDLPFSPDWQLQGEIPKTEAQMMRMVFDQADLPEDFKKQVRVTVVDAPMQKKSDGTLRRPNTNDTVQEWLRTNPKPGTCLLSSNQPYAGRQHSVACTILPETFVVETIGAAAQNDLPIVIYLDTLARWLYQERKRRA